MNNLPAIPDDPIFMPMRQLLARDMGAEVRRTIGALEAIANLCDDLQQLFPQPVPCPACHIDLIRLNDVQRRDHWRSHGYVARMMAHIRRIGT